MRLFQTQCEGKKENEKKPLGECYVNGMEWLTRYKKRNETEPNRQIYAMEYIRCLLNDR